MRADLMGLPLEQALSLLREEGKEPVISRTLAPRVGERAGGRWRVIAASDDGLALTVGQFLDPTTHD